MCLALIEHMPSAPALDAGCGSGLLAQAWAAGGRGPVDGRDLDARAVAQARAGIALAGLEGRVTLRRAPLEALEPDALVGRVLLANVPAGAHRVLLERADGAPRAAVLSGLRPADAAMVVDGWTRRGLRAVRYAAAGGFCAIGMRGPG